MLLIYTSLRNSHSKGWHTGLANSPFSLVMMGALLALCHYILGLKHKENKPENLVITDVFCTDCRISLTAIFCSLWAAMLYQWSKLLSCLVTERQGFHWCHPPVCSGGKRKARPFCCLYNSPGQMSSSLPAAPSIIPSVWVCKPTSHQHSSHRAAPYWLASSVRLTTA